jgi:hypothetical protein
MTKILQLFVMITCLGFVNQAWAKGLLKEELDQYAKVQEALAADSLDEAKSAAATLVKKTKTAGLKQPAQKIAQASSLEAARKEFKRLSSLVVASLKKEPKAGYNAYTCPMARAEWMQMGTDVANPYFGKSMASCGMPVK